jgi:hypothetical protein
LIRGITSKGISRSWLGVAIDGKGDADAAKQQLGLLAAIFQRVGGVSFSQRESSW